MDAARLGARGAVVVAWSGGRGRVLTDGHASGGARIGETTLFHAGSAGKHVTACVVLSLAQAGLVDLEAPIGAVLPQLSEAWGVRTTRQLLHHTSGLPDYLVTSAGRSAPTTGADLAALSAVLPPFAEPGACWSYSNTNYILLGLLAERVGGGPCGLQMQALLADAGAGGARVASPDWVRALASAPELGDGGDDEVLTREVIGDGDVAFDAPSALAWLQALIEGRAGPAELFGPAELTEGAPAPYGCGLFLERIGDARLVHHAGHFDGFTAMLAINHKAQAGVFALCDGAPGHSRAVRALALQVLEAFAPGATPLSLEPLPDPAPEITRRVRAQLLRGDAPPDPHAFTPSMRGAMRAAPGRGVINLSAGGEPLRFDLVSEHPEPRRTMRRYRLTHADRVEHVCVGVTPDGRIDWAWPL